MAMLFASSSLVFWSTLLGLNFWKSTYSPFSMRVRQRLEIAAGVYGLGFTTGDTNGGTGGKPGCGGGVRGDVRLSE